MSRRARLPRPANRRDTGDRLKLHRHYLRLAGRDYTVVTPRPGTEVLFAFAHQGRTWRIFSDLRGARFLGRLLWGLSYQRQPNTIVLIGAPFLEVAPFEAAPSLPMVFAPAPAAPFGTDAARALKHKMPTGPGHGTVRWHTPGLDHRTDQEWERAEEARLHRAELRYSFAMRAGLVVFSVAPPLLRLWGRDIHGMAGDYLTPWDNHRHLGVWTHLTYGDEAEMRLLTRFREETERLRRTRREVLASPDAPDDPLLQRHDTFARAFAPPAR
ncbi:hypothetical protein F4561_002562 [Lipingzhangella halophila]|uniref:Uncharacterized protein n=1 Tax=Lipingzhangella halophila TaxID=1783352 RepID=A0A7W7RGV8_9ACTN|nr:hypothetical protein [Lipingzhangella halophila]MBB4931742.1 hypothetical protein [Lipingzhangella halophila]